ncbi:hypothetical protein AB0J83_21340 [Actinoplanes sp. NPDC049596]
MSDQEVTPFDGEDVEPEGTEAAPDETTYSEEEEEFFASAPADEPEVD